MLTAYVSGDEETMRASIAPDGEIYGAPGLINAGTYHGYEGFRQWIAQWEEAWGEVDYDLREPVDFGETIVVIPVRITGRGAGSGLEVDSQFGWLYEIKDDQMVRFHVYPAVDEALEAAARLSGSA
jgi:ketosteroid isomerase-like protein